MHSHKCTKCGTTWEHPDSCAGSDEAHRCPDCGEITFRRWKTQGSQPVKYPHPAPSFKPSPLPTDA